MSLVVEKIEERRDDWIEVFAGGDIFLLKNDPRAFEKFRKAMTPLSRDLQGWCIAWLLKHGYIAMYDKDGRDITDRALKAIDNTLKILGIHWERVEEFLKTADRS